MLPFYQLLERLRLISAPPGTRFSAAELSLRGLLPLWLAGLLLVATGVLVVWLYLSETGRLGRGRRLALAGIRVVLIALVLALLMRPVLLAEFTGERPRPVFVLLDDTQSMRQADRRVSTADKMRVALAKGLLPAGTNLEDGSLLAKTFTGPWSDISRRDLLQAVLDNPDLALLDGLKKVGPVQVMRFSESAQVLEGGPKALTADGEKTALADVLYEIVSASGTDLPGALVVASDGRDNASKRTLEEVATLCKEKGVPVHVYGVGPARAGILQIKEVAVPDTVFIDEKAEGKDDPVEVPIRYRLRGFTGGKLRVVVQLGDKTEERIVPVAEGEDLRIVVPIVPAKGKEGVRDFLATVEVVGQPSTLEEVRRTVAVKTSRVKVLFVESTPRREYKFIQPALDRDRRLLMRYYLVEGDKQLAEAVADKDSGAMFLDRFPDNFPDATPKDTDKRPYDLLVLGDVALSSLGRDGATRILRFVREGGGLLLIAGRNHAPAEYLGTDLAKLLPVEFTKQTFPITDSSPPPFRPVLTYEGEHSSLLSLADKGEENLELWKEELWKNVPGLYWHYPVTDLKPGAVSLLGHPEKKVGRRPDEKPMPLIARHYYGRGEVVFVGVEETWRIRDGSGDILTARLWGQMALQLGLPHLLGNDKRTQLELERNATLGRPGTLKARVLDSSYEPVTRASIKGKLIHLPDGAGVESRPPEPIALRRLKRQPGEYRATLPNDVEGRFRLEIDPQPGVETTVMPYRVDLPPRHERERAPIDEEALRSLAERSGGRYHREDDLPRLVANVQPQSASFVQRQEVLLWNAVPLVLFVLLITAEWVLRKFSNLS